VPISASPGIQFFGLLLICSLLVRCSPTLEHTREKPNIVFIMADDLGYADLSIYGRTDYQTPNIDALAHQGVLFTQAYSASPVCSPTRVGFMTGRFPWRHPVGLLEPLGLEHETFGISSSDRTVPRILRDAGYETALIGKWHLGTAEDFHPFESGFDEFYGFLDSYHDYTGHFGEGSVSRFHDGRELVTEEGYLTELFTERAVEFISRERDRPFFLSLQYNAPHWPWQAPGDPPNPETSEGGSPETYRLMVESLDQGVGRVLAAIETQGLAKETLVVFTSDNGGERYSDMGPLKGAKFTLWEGGIRVPALAAWPGVIPEGTRTNQVASTMDWSATFLSLAERDPSMENFDGIDLIPIAVGREPEADRTLLWRWDSEHLAALRAGKWKYLIAHDEAFLFDLSVDVGEELNLKDRYPAELARMQELFVELNSQMLPPRPAFVTVY
jgi:arylsulfatase A-like enzyme